MHKKYVKRGLWKNAYTLIFVSCLAFIENDANAIDHAEYHSYTLASLNLKTYSEFEHASKKEKAHEINKINTIMRASHSILESHSIAFNQAKQAEEDGKRTLSQYIENKERTLKILETQHSCDLVSIDNYTELLWALEHTECGLFIISEEENFMCNYGLYIPISDRPLSIQHIKSGYLSWIADYRVIELNAAETTLLWQKSMIDYYKFPSYTAFYASKVSRKPIFHTSAALCPDVCQLAINRKKPYYIQQLGFYCTAAAEKRTTQRKINQFLEAKEQRIAATAATARRDAIDLLRTQTGYDLYQLEEIHTYFSAHLNLLNEVTPVHVSSIDAHQHVLPKITADTFIFIQNEITESEWTVIQSKRKPQEGTKECNTKKKKKSKKKEMKFCNKIG
ncbi:MAG: hypothetical protein V4482_00220 [Pseudomonadota bacterium]